MTAGLSTVTARAGANIAIVKYWGKRDETLNLPATGSLSLTLAGLGTRTSVRFARDAAGSDGRDRVIADGAPAAGAFTERVCRFLDLVRAQAGMFLPACVTTHNSVPTAAGLASSASGFAALALAATRAAGLNLASEELSALARRGSGSAARSVFGGFVEMARGQRADGRDAHARQLLAPGAWDVRLVVAMTQVGPKAMGSSEAMALTARTSPYYAAWIAEAERDLGLARAAVLERDLGRLGGIAERSALRMHACAMAAWPPVIYWTGVTLAALRAVLDMQAQGTAAHFTIDAGPHVKVLCAAADAPSIEAELRSVPGVVQTLVAAPGPGAEVVAEDAP